MPTPLRLIARMNFSLKNYGCELFNLIGTVGKVELISAFTTVVCESWNVLDKHSPSQRLTFHHADVPGVEYGEKFATSCLFKMQKAASLSSAKNRVVVEDSVEESA